MGGRRMKASKMNLDVTAFGVDQLTKPRSTGRPINVHEVRRKPASEPDYDRMRELVHNKPQTEERRAD